MGKKILIYIAGIITGIFATFGVLYSGGDDEDKIVYLKDPVNYENKTSTSFKVFQVLGNSALAKEISDKQFNWYNGTTVLLVEGQFYCNQIIDVEKPVQIGTYTYQTKERQILGTRMGGNIITVPVIEINKNSDTQQ